METDQKSKINSRQGTSKSKRAETLLHESHLLRNMMENMQMIAVMLDMNANITFCNDHFLNIAGWKREDIMGANWFEIFIKDMDENVYQIFQNATKSGNIISHYENKIFTKNGAERLVKWSNTLLHDKSGEIIGTASIGEDIT